MRILNPSGYPEEVSDTCRISSSPAWSYVFHYNTGPYETSPPKWVVGYYDYLGITYPYLGANISMVKFGFQQAKVLVCTRCEQPYTSTARTQKYCPECLEATVLCGACGETFKIRKTRLDERLKNGNHIYCSRACSSTKKRLSNEESQDA